MTGLLALTRRAVVAAGMALPLVPSALRAANLDWSDRSVERLLIKGPSGDRVRLIAPDWAREVTLDARDGYRFAAGRQV